MNEKEQKISVLMQQQVSALSIPKETIFQMILETEFPGSTGTEGASAKSLMEVYEQLVAFEKGLDNIWIKISIQEDKEEKKKKEGN